MRSASCAFHAPESAEDSNDGGIDDPEVASEPEAKRGRRRVAADARDGEEALKAPRHTVLNGSCDSLKAE